MGAVAKNPMPELVAVAAERINESANRARIIGLDEARSISRFVPIVVLLPAREDDKSDSLLRVNNTLADLSTASAFVELFDKVARPPKVGSSESELVFGEARVNFSFMEASYSGQPVKLTAMEFKTLRYLAQHSRRVVSRNELLSEVWGYEHYPTTRTVDNYILRLRRKLERDQSRPVHIRTVHRAGYKFLP